MVVSRFTSGGGGGQVINEASGSDSGIVQTLMNPVVIGIAGIAAWMAFN